MEYELGKKVRLLREYCGVTLGSVGRIFHIDPEDDENPIRVKFSDLSRWPPVDILELIEEAPEVDLTKITTPVGLLDEGTKQRLQDWPHGLEQFVAGVWITKEDPHLLALGVTYRAKPAPERKAVWVNVYNDRMSAFRDGRKQADMWAAVDRTAVWRIEYNEDGSDPEIFVEEV